MPGRFIYPPPNSETVVMTYNYIDSVDVSWETTGTNSSEAFLELYYYLEGDPWKLGYNHSVSVNGSQTVNLNIIDGGYYGQFNFFYGDTKEFLSVFFNADHNTTQKPVTWNASGGTTIVSSASASTSTSTSKSASTSESTSMSSSSSSSTTTHTSPTATLLPTSSPTTSTTYTVPSNAAGSAATSSSPPSSTSTSSGLGTGATVSIALATTTSALAFLGVSILFWLRRKKAKRATNVADIGDKLTTTSSSSSYSSSPPLFYGQSQTQQKQVESPIAEIPDARYSLYPPRQPQRTLCVELGGGRGVQELPG